MGRCSEGLFRFCVPGKGPRSRKGSPCLLVCNDNTHPFLLRLEEGGGTNGAPIIYMTRCRQWGKKHFFFLEHKLIL